jgi:hypothetical protein
MGSGVLLWLDRTGSFCGESSISILSPSRIASAQIYAPTRYGAGPRTASARHTQAGRLRPDHQLAGDADYIGETALLQPGAKLAAIAVVGIGQHDPIRHAPGAGLVDALQG